MKVTVPCHPERSRGISQIPRPAREYLLKGLVRCVHCGMPLWERAHRSGQTYYREHRGSRGEGVCVNTGGAVRCEVVDEQVGQIIETMVLPDDWLDMTLERISLRDEVARVHFETDSVPPCR